MTSELLSRLAREEDLRAAWAAVRQGGPAPGLDGVRLEQFEFHRERELARLRRELLTGTYRPWPARRVRLPKPDGGARRIGIQTARDRVAQRSLLAPLRPRVEPLLEDCSFAYRPGRSVAGALARLEQWRAAGFGWAARADVFLCFDTLHRERLLAQAATVLPEADCLALVRAWLETGVVDELGWSDPGAGVPQGDVLSPLLCNLYLDPFDEEVTRCAGPLVRYADDFVLLARSQEEAHGSLRHAATALGRLGLELNDAKSRVGSFLQGFEYLGAAVVGSLHLPLRRVERPGRAPLYRFGYGPPTSPQSPARPSPTTPPLVSTERALRDRFVALLRAERAGQPLPPMAAALLDAWREAGWLAAEEPRSQPEAWQSVYLI